MAEPIPMPKPSPVAASRAIGNDAAIPNNSVVQRVVAGLRMYIGQGRRYSVAMIAEHIGVHEEMVRRYMSADNNSLPGTAVLLRLLAILPEEFANHLLEAAGLTGAYRIGDGNVIPAAALADQLDAAAKLADALKDGNINHQERLSLAPVMRALGSRLSELAAQWERERG